MTPPTEHAAADTLTVWAPDGLPEFRPGDDLAQALITSLSRHCAGVRDGDIVVVTSKVVSKVEGRVVATPTDPEERDALRRALVEAESVRHVARVNRTLITENHLGLVQAAAGIDGSNVQQNELVLLPVDPDRSARDLVDAFHTHLGVAVAVIITDTMGRAWRTGQTDAAIGAAGMHVSVGYSGMTDRQGNDLVVTDIAVADEAAAAADLAKGKLGGRPVAVIRGLKHLVTGRTDEQPCARDLVRAPEADLFRLGTAEALDQGRREAVPARRSVRTFSPHPVADEAVRAAIADALTAPAPHHSHPIRIVRITTPQRRQSLLDAMRTAWESDLRADGFTDEQVARRLARGDLLRHCPVLLVPFLDQTAGAHYYSDARRRDCEHTMFTVAGGAAVQSLLVALAARGIGSCWVGSTIFTAEIVTQQLELPAHWQPLGAVAAGIPADPPAPRHAIDIDPYYVEL